MKERKEIRLNAEAVREALPAVPADFAARAEGLIAGLPAERTEPMKKKVSLGLALAAVLTLLALGALAAVLLTGQELVEQEAVPVAQQNDTQWRTTTEFSPEELAEFIRKCSENGIDLDETDAIMQAIRRGEGYDEEETIMAVCRAAFGGNYGEWTLAQQYWFQDMMVAIGYAAGNDMQMPGTDDLTEEAALAEAVRQLQAKYGAETPLADRTRYCVERSFSRDEDTGESFWWFSFTPREIDLPQAAASLNKAGELTDSSWTAPDWTPGTYSADAALGAAQSVWGWDMEHTWTQEQWLRLGRLIADADPEVEPGFYNRNQIAALRQTVYAEPTEQDLPRERAEEIALAACEGEEKKPWGAVLMEADGRRIWKICVRTLRERGTYMDSYDIRMLELDAATGEILNSRMQDAAVENWARWVPDSVYSSIMADVLTEAQAIDLAAEKLREEPGLAEAPLMDSAVFERLAWRMGKDAWEITFRPKTLDWTECRVSVTDAGEASVTAAEQFPLTADNVIQRCRNAMGWWGDWDQAKWVEVSRLLEGFTEAETRQGRVLLKTRYPEADAARISADEAVNICFRASGVRAGEVLSHVLIAAEPHPLWKVCFYGFDGTVEGVMLWEVDGETGEVTDRDFFTPDNEERDPSWRRYTTRAAWAAAILEEEGVFPLACSAVWHTYGDMTLDDPAMDLPLEDDEVFTPEIDGLHVYFRSRWSNFHDYEVTLDEHGLPLAVDELESSGSEMWEGESYGNG